jgi:hybrid cluster-associated redox disulfide protein
MVKKPKITKEMTITQVIKRYPKTIFVFMDFGLHCVGCPAAPDETIEEAAQTHRLDLRELLENLNKTI